MTQTTALVETLKKALKAHGKTYADVAKQLHLSEASVKRMFAQRCFSLQRLEQVCQLMTLEISDLVQMMAEETRRPLAELTEAQEQELVSDLELLLVTICVLNRWTLDDITTRYAFPKTTCIRKLAKLDRLRIIELLPKNRIKLQVAPNFSWRRNGPIQRFFQEKVEADFFRAHFNSETDKLLVLNGMVSASANAVFQRKMQRLAGEFEELNENDAPLPVEEKHWNTVVLALRQWQYGAFDPFRRK